jgi:hypothetical protein
MVKQNWIPVLGCALLAAIIRLLALNIFEQSILFEPVESSVHDRSLYVHAINEVASGNYWPEGSFHYLPLYPWVMGTIAKAFGFSLKLAALFGILLDTCTTVLIVLLARRLGAHVMLAALAGVLFAAYPLAIIYSLLTMPNTLNALGVTAFVYAAQTISAKKTDRSFPWLAFPLGLLAGIIALGFAGMLLMSVVTFLVITIQKRSIPFMMLGLAGLILPIIPIARHNTAAEGRLVLLTTHGGLNLYMGNHEHATGYPLRIKNFRMSAQSMLEDAHRYVEQEVGHPLTKAESSAWWRDRARAFWREHPGQSLFLTIKKVVLFWNFREVDDLRMLEQLRILDPPFENFIGTPFALFSMLGIIGLFFVRSATVPRLALLAGMAGLVMFFITSRYRLTFVPLMAGLGAAGLGVMWQEWKDKKYWKLIQLVPMITLILFPFYMRDQRPVDYHNAAIQLMNRGRDAEAASVVARGLEIDPNSADLYFARGNLFFKQEKFTEAAVAFNQSLACNPDNPTTAFNLALSLARKGDYCGARDALLKRKNLKLPSDDKVDDLFNELDAACDAR